MNRRQMFLSTAKAALASGIGGSLGFEATSAQAQAAKLPVKAAPPQVSVLPYPDPEFKESLGERPRTPSRTFRSRFRRLKGRPMCCSS